MSRVTLVFGLVFIFVAGAVALTCTPSDQPTPQPTAEDSTVYVWPDTVYLTWPDTVHYRGDSHVVDFDTWVAWLSNIQPDTTGAFTHRGFYHAYAATGTVDSLVLGEPFAWAYWSPPLGRGRISHTTGLLQFKLMTDGVPPDSGYVVIRETGGRP